jgi:hypothetical protein
LAPRGPPGDTDLNDGAGADRGGVTVAVDVGIVLDGGGPDDLDDEDVGAAKWVLSWLCCTQISEARAAATRTSEPRILRTVGHLPRCDRRARPVAGGGSDGCGGGRGTKMTWPSRTTLSHWRDIGARRLRPPRAEPVGADVAGVLRSFAGVPLTGVGAGFFGAGSLADEVPSPRDAFVWRPGGNDSWVLPAGIAMALPRGVLPEEPAPRASRPTTAARRTDMAAFTALPAREAVIVPLTMVEAPPVAYANAALVPARTSVPATARPTPDLRAPIRDSDDPPEGPGPSCLGDPRPPGPPGPGPAVISIVDPCSSPGRLKPKTPCLRASTL